MTGNSDSLFDTPSHADGALSPGRIVRQARETAQLSIEDLAAQIKLARYTLDAIERDDFAQLNEPVYVRGYYRKLAKVLPVSEPELLALYEQMAGRKAPPHPSKLILAGDPELGSSNRVSLRLAATVIGAGMLIGVLAFWGKAREQAPVVVAPAETLPAPAPEASGAATAEPGAHPATGEAPSPLQAPTPGADTATPPPAPAEPAPAAATGPAVEGALQLQFSGTSWAEVKDASGKTLLSGLIEAGNTQSLSGRAPIEVFLGNAPVVKVSFNGQPVDTSGLSRDDNTARITLP